MYDLRVEFVLRLDGFLPLKIRLLVGLCIANHALDVRIAESAAALDDDALLLTSGLVASADMQDAVRIDVEGHLDLRKTARGGGEATQLELAKSLVVGSHLALALQNLRQTDIT